MTRRSAATVAAGVAVVLLVVALVASPLPYVTMEPGPTVDVLGDTDEEPVVSIDGARTYPTTGQLRLVTVSESTYEHQVRLVEAMGAWLDEEDALLPREVVFPEQTTGADERAVSAAQMVNSQDTAVAAALERLGYDLETFPEVVGVSADGPSAGKLELRDRLRRIDGRPTPTLRSVYRRLADVEPGDTVSVVVERGSFDDPDVERVRITTVADPDDPDRALIGIFPGTGYEFPFTVEVGIGSGIGGPSAGLMFALAIYDALTPGKLTGGRDIAGTGTITADGQVGDIGGVRQKVFGARRDGATLFLVPPGNCADVVGLDADGIRLARAESLESAIETLTAYADDPDADLPECS